MKIKNLKKNNFKWELKRISKTRNRQKISFYKFGVYVGS